MKKIIAAAVTVLLAMTASAQSGKAIYNKYSDADDVSAVYISPAMFRMIGKIPSLSIEGDEINLGSIINSLSGMYILDSSNRGINSSLKKDAEKFIEKGQYELLMEAKDNGETTRMFTMGDKKTVTGLVMLTSDSSACTFIGIEGQMDRAALEKILSQSDR